MALSLVHNHACMKLRIRRMLINRVGLSLLEIVSEDIDMAKYYVLFNPLSDNKKGWEDARKIEEIMEAGEFRYQSVLEVESFEKILSEVPADETVVLAGGDGTINKFVNMMEGTPITRDILYFPAGSGNDFMHDVSEDGSLKYVKLNPYIENLPWVEVNGLKQRFINGIGYGIDGYCCEVADEIRKSTDKPINYASIAIKGLLFHFASKTATVVTDGETRVFKNVWLVPTMNGRFYGGGMNATPGQDRLNKDGKLSTLIFMGKSRLKTLSIFPNMFKGTHVNYPKAVQVIEGKCIEVSFDKPCALQIDGETVLNVTSYKVYR